MSGEKWHLNHSQLVRKILWFEANLDGNSGLAMESTQPEMQKKGTELSSKL